MQATVYIEVGLGCASRRRDGDDNDSGAQRCVVVYLSSVRRRSRRQRSVQSVDKERMSGTRSDGAGRRRRITHAVGLLMLLLVQRQGWRHGGARCWSRHCRLTTIVHTHTTNSILFPTVTQLSLHTEYGWGTKFVYSAFFVRSRFSPPELYRSA